MIKFNSKSLNHLIKLFSSLSLIIFLLIFIWFFRYRFIITVSTDEINGMKSAVLEGYTDRMFYFQNDTIKFYFKSKSTQNNIYIDRIISPYTYDRVYQNSFGKIEQKINTNQSEFGCNWEESLSFIIGSSFKDGYYLVILEDDLNNEFKFPIIINDNNKNSKIALLSPISTWNAYNPWGGKSLYKNIIDSSSVYFVSTQRPNTLLLEGKHNMQVEANIFNWFEDNYDINIYPDNILDYHPNILSDASIIILSYHCEYISSKTYNKLISLVKSSGKSMISIGANQIYWKTKWDSDFKTMECRKDLTFFKDTYSLGGMWKHNFKNESKFLGVRYSNPGYGTYAPYKITNLNHWLLDNIQIGPDSLFGKKGLDSLGLSGLETDKVTKFSKDNVEIIAKGTNPGNGGADMIFKLYDYDNAILSTGSIQSGSGLGTDIIFTKIIKNFTDKYYK